MVNSDAPSSTSALDVVAIGRFGVDLYPLQSEVTLDKVTTFGKFLGGSAANVTVASARHGLNVALISRTGKDPFGTYLVDEITRLGVRADFISEVEGINTPITFCEIFPPDDFPIYFYRDPIAPDLVIHPEELPLEAIKSAGIFWATGTGLSQEPSRSAHFAAWEARARRSHTILDLDFRPHFWPDRTEATRIYADALQHVTVAVGNKEECEVAVGETEPHRAADALLERGIELAIVKQGPKGVLAKTRDEAVEVPPYPVDVVNGLGAGDAFGGALCLGLTKGWSLEKTMRAANIAGAIVAGRLECSTAMPETEEILAVLEAANG